jgi:hypothetical protein
VGPSDGKSARRTVSAAVDSQNLVHGGVNAN